MRPCFRLVTGIFAVFAFCILATLAIPFPIGRDPQVLEWGDCGYTTPLVQPYDFQCAFVRVPLEWTRPEPAATDITLHVSRLRQRGTASPDASTQMWLMQGGPGGSGQTMLSFAAALPQSGVTMYFPDHRGTGLSSPLSCGGHGAPYDDACLSYVQQTVGAVGSGLRAYTTTNAAADLAYLMRCVALTDAGPIVPYAVSYGSYWLNRFLVLFGDNNITTAAGGERAFVSGAIMDGVVHPLYLSISQYAVGVDETARNFLSYCAQDEFCAAMFAEVGSPIVVLRNLLNDIEAGTQTCVAQNFPSITAAAVRRFIFQTLQPASNYYARNIIPAVIFRLVRCSADDVTALRIAFSGGSSAAEAAGNAPVGTAFPIDTARPVRSTVGPITFVILRGIALHKREEEKSAVAAEAVTAAPDPFAFSDVLNYNIVLSELFTSVSEAAPTAASLAVQERSTLASSNDSLNYMTAWPKWPTYMPDQYRAQVASFTPLLMLSGELDPSGVSWFANDLHIATPQRTLVRVPLAGHVTAMMADPSVNLPCPLQIIMSYVTDPSRTVDSTCLAALPRRIDFAGSSAPVQAAALAAFNTTNMWGCADPARPCPVALAGVQPVWPPQLPLCSGLACLPADVVLGIGLTAGLGAATLLLTLLYCGVLRRIQQTSADGAETSALLPSRPTEAVPAVL